MMPSFKKNKTSCNKQVIEQAKKVINKTQLTIKRYSPAKDLTPKSFLNKSQRLYSTQED